VTFNEDEQDRSFTSVSSPETEMSPDCFDKDVLSRTAPSTTARTGGGSFLDPRPSNMRTADTPRRVRETAGAASRHLFSKDNWSSNPESPESAGENGVPDKQSQAPSTGGGSASPRRDSKSPRKERKEETTSQHTPEVSGSSKVTPSMAGFASLRNLAQGRSQKEAISPEKRQPSLTPPTGYGREDWRSLIACDKPRKETLPLQRREEPTTYSKPLASKGYAGRYHAPTHPKTETSLVVGPLWR